LKNGHIEDGASVLTVGWGQTSDGWQFKTFDFSNLNCVLCLEVAGLSDDLRYANLVTLSHEECLAAFGTQINEDMLCVAGNYNEGTCRVCF
jgi:hypothetical protein